MKKIKKEMLFAHRGLHNKKIKENSVKAFERAIKNGFGIELDIRMTKDKVLIVFHDKEINGIKIENLMYKDIYDYIPKIEDVFELIEKLKGTVLLEIKESLFSKELRTKLMKELKYVNINFAIISFNPRTVRWFKKNGCFVGQSIDKTNLPKILEEILIKGIIKSSNPDFLIVEKTILKNKSIRKARKTKKVISWTIKSEIEKSQALLLSDNVIFDEY